MATPKEQAEKSVDRMKTETIHAQALTLEYLRRRVDELEQINTKLTESNRSLQLKLLSANRTIDRMKGEATT